MSRVAVTFVTTLVSPSACSCPSLSVGSAPGSVCPPAPVALTRPRHYPVQAQVPHAIPTDRQKTEAQRGNPEALLPPRSLRGAPANRVPSQNLPSSY